MKLPNGPKTPQLLRTLKLVARPLEYMDDYAQRYGDFFTVGSQNSPVVYCSNPKAIQELFTADSERFEIGKGNRILRFLLGDKSLLLMDGPQHQRQRRLLMPPFHGDRLRTYNQLICDITAQVTAQWEVGKPFPIRLSMQEITLRVILQAVFGLHQGDRYEQLRQLLSSLLEAIGSPLSSALLFFPSLQKDWGSLSPWGRFLRQKQKIQQLIYDEIRDRREQGDFSGTDILTLLMSARDQAGQPMTDQELHDELMTLLVAGHETTASALTWALYWTHHLPEVEEKLRCELGTLSDDADKGKISRLPYLTAVCQETLRIYPIAITTFPRILKSPLELMGHDFKAGTVLLPSIYLVHQREDIYPEPKRFQPERFLERQFSPYEYFPFGGSDRLCIGMALAQMEMKLVLATILSRFHLALVDQRPAKPVRRGLTVAPPSKMQMVVIERVKTAEAQNANTLPK
ncbi:MAG: cytochrome P450 [Kastovskya adunca ATA6-11-RM4]|jgi:cytochrome P450|nr:cytochrome P450 [Kastovskya adunca ATA6-11-RM4]